ncbi:MAG: DUF4249 family protein, partial [Bacteroidales bacterium]
MKRYVILWLMSLLLTSCEEQINWDLQPGTTASVVVDGIITDELKTQTLTITKPIASINLQAEPVSGATVLVSTDEVVYTFRESPTTPGTYISDSPFAGIPGKTYSLLINDKTRTYSAKSLLATAKTFSFLKYEHNSDDGKYRITSVAKSYDPTDPAMYEISLDWSKAPGYEIASPDSCKAKLFYYTLPTIDVSEVFAPSIEKVNFPKGTVISERRYSLTNEHAAFVRSLLLETTWQG